MYKFLCRGWISGHEYVPYEDDYRFFACVCADSFKEARIIARSLAPVECNHVSIVILH